MVVTKPSKVTNSRFILRADGLDRNCITLAKLRSLEALIRSLRWGRVFCIVHKIKALRSALLQAVSAEHCDWCSVFPSGQSKFRYRAATVKYCNITVVSFEWDFIRGERAHSWNFKRKREIAKQLWTRVSENTYEWEREKSDWYIMGIPLVLNVTIVLIKVRNVIWLSGIVKKCS